MWILTYNWCFELFSGYFFKPWRLLLLIYALPGVIGGIWLYTMPESPKYLLSQGRDGDALNIVRWVYRVNKGKLSNEGFEIEKLLPENVNDSDNKKGM